MPIYVYRCPKCGQQTEIFTREQPPLKPRCLAHDALMVQVPAAANFKIDKAAP